MRQASAGPGDGAGRRGGRDDRGGRGGARRLGRSAGSGTARPGGRAEQRRHESVRSVSYFAVDAVPTDLGTVAIMLDGDVLFQADLARLDAYVFRPAGPVLVEPGQRVLVAVTCVSTLSRAGTCQVDVTFPVVVEAR